MTRVDTRYDAHSGWSVPARHTTEVMALSLWLDGRRDEARAALETFTAIGAAEFAGLLDSFRDAVIAAGNARMGTQHQRWRQHSVSLALTATRDRREEPAWERAVEAGERVPDESPF